MARRLPRLPLSDAEVQRSLRRLQRVLPNSVADVELGLKKLVEARNLFQRAVCPKTVARIRLAISSAKGAQRHIHHRNAFVR